MTTSPALEKAMASPVEIMALKKLCLVIGTLAMTFQDQVAARETKALLSVLMDVTKRLEKANG